MLYNNIVSLFTMVFSCASRVYLSFEPWLNLTLPLLSNGVYITGDSYILRTRSGTYLAEIKFNTLMVGQFETKGFMPQKQKQ